MTLSVTGDNIQFPDLSVQNTAATGFGFKNRIINGSMTIDQRNAGASVTPTTGYTLDRWRVATSLGSKFSFQQSTTAPSAYSNSALITSLSSYTVGAAENFRFEQFIEGFNAADLAWGTAAAQAVTFSFWVRSSLTGTFGGAILNSAENRSYPFSYSITAANTWEQKTVTVTGDTSGTWLTTNGIGIRLSFSLGAGATVSGTSGVWSGSFYTSATGAVSVVGTSGATFYITGVQLEKGSTATAYDFRDYGRELIMCQRYYYKTVGNASFTTLLAGVGTNTNTSVGQCGAPHPVVMRATPTSTVANLTAYNGNTNNAVTAINANGSSVTNAALNLTTTGVVVSVPHMILAQANGYFDMSAEL